ncbi:MAG: GNAT family N-acetyltransferase [Firmicutes bacterium]|nr:GNAT family N-acetyltransferase [Bacillota bacterium]
MIEYNIAKEEELKTCALLSAEAFRDYEYFSVYYPNNKRRYEFIDAVLVCDIKAKYNDPKIKILTMKESEKIIAVAHLFSPGYKNPTTFEYIKQGALKAMFIGGIRTTIAWLNMNDSVSAPCHELPGKNRYLGLLTVVKKYQRQGFGSKFLNDYLIPHVKKEGGETFSLNTNAKKNCKFYEKNGFNLFDERTYTYKGNVLGNWSYVMNTKE